MKAYLIVLMSVLLAGCTLLTGPGSVPQAWIDAPLDKMVLPLAPYEIVAHAGDATGISEIEFNVNGTVIGSVAAGGPLFTARQSWSPAAPGEYVIQARGKNGGGTWSDYAEVTVTVQGETAASPSPTLQGQTPTTGQTPSQPTFTLTQNGNCRRGPGQAYGVVTSLVAGSNVPIVAKNEDGTWWLVRIPTGELCWFSAVVGSQNGNPNAVPVATAQPLPPTPEPEQGCFVYDPNQTAVCTVPCPPNANPGGACTP